MSRAFRDAVVEQMHGVFVELARRMDTRAGYERVGRDERARAVAHMWAPQAASALSLWVSKVATDAHVRLSLERIQKTVSDLCPDALMHQTGFAADEIAPFKEGLSTALSKVLSRGNQTLTVDGRRVVIHYV